VICAVGAHRRIAAVLRSGKYGDPSFALLGTACGFS
jgi:hypothetical protein